MKQKNENKKCVLYARFSPRRNAESCDSCQAQLAILRQRAAVEGYEIIGEFADENISGASDNRPGLLAALEAVKNNRAILMVYSLSRLARSTVRALEIACDIDKWGGGIYTEKEHISTRGKYDRFVFTIFSALAQLEREMVSERTADAMRVYMDQGRKMGGKPPYGYRFIGKRMVPDLYEQRVARRIVELRNMVDKKGRPMPYRKIAKRINYEGYRTRDSRQWFAQQVIRIYKAFKDGPPYRCIGPNKESAGGPEVLTLRRTCR